MEGQLSLQCMGQENTYRNVSLGDWLCRYGAEPCLDNDPPASSIASSELPCFRSPVLIGTKITLIALHASSLVATLSGTFAHKL